MATKIVYIGDKPLVANGKVVQVDVASGSSVENIEWHQCPEAVRNYLAAVTYDPSDYSISNIETYLDGTVQANPIGQVAGSKIYYNEEPNRKTPYANNSSAGTLKPLDSVRWIKSPERNVRDLGGWACDGGTIKYGKLFRGGEVSASDTNFVNTLHDGIGIRAELELQGTDAVEDYSVIGSDVDFCCPKDGGAYWAYYNISNTASMKEAFRFIFDSVMRDRPLYFHCSAGADRTGTIACLIEAILGVSQSDIDKDYELTSFNGSDYLRKRCGREYATDQWEYGYKNLIMAITALAVGSTFRDKVINYIASLGFTANEINAFRVAMINGSPEAVTPSISMFSVTNNLSSVSSDNSVSNASQYQPYTATITPNNGYVIDSIKVIMGGSDITSTVFKGSPTVMRYLVTKVLKNCSIDNNKKAVIAGEGYGATITPENGYTLDGAAVSITIGGVDMSAYYSGGKITIPSVTGDVVITVTAAPSAPAYTNLFDTSAIHEGYRINSGASLEANSSQSVSNDITLGGAAVTVRIKGSGANTATNTYRVCYYNGSSWTSAKYIQAQTSYSYDSVSDTITFVSSNNSLFTKMRFSYPKTSDANSIVVTINEEIS